MTQLMVHVESVMIQMNTEHSSDLESRARERKNTQD
jgi:hypothetical protein